jgi:hypothetical protein
MNEDIPVIGDQFASNALPRRLSVPIKDEVRVGSRGSREN